MKVKKQDELENCITTFSEEIERLQTMEEKRFETEEFFKISLVEEVMK